MSPKLAEDLAARGIDDANILFANVREAAKTLRVSESFLNKARCENTGPPFVRFGHNVRYHVPTLMAWAEAQTCVPGGKAA